MPPSESNPAARRQAPASLRSTGKGFPIAGKGPATGIRSPGTGKGLPIAGKGPATGIRSPATGGHLPHRRQALAGDHPARRRPRKHPPRRRSLSRHQQKVPARKTRARTSLST